MNSLQLKLTVKLAHSHGKPKQSEVRFSDTGTAGRNAENDLVLTDPSRIISGLHCRFIKRADRFYIRDESSNGTFINETELYLSNGEEYPLKEKDEISIGDYRLIVGFEEASSPEPSKKDAIANFPDLSVIEEQLRVLSNIKQTQDPEPSDHAKKLETESIAHAQAPDATPATSPSPELQQSRASTSDNLIQSFLKGAGLDDSVFNHVCDEEAMELIGCLLREYTEGIVKTLGVRNHIRAELNANRTMVVPTQNNQLKYSVDAEDGLSRLLGKPKNSYMAPKDAIKESFSDIQKNMLTVLATGSEALNEAMMELNPEKIEQHVDQYQKSNQFFGKYKRYWTELKTRFEKFDAYNSEASSTGLANIYKKHNKGKSPNA